MSLDSFPLHRHVCSIAQIRNKSTIRGAAAADGGFPHVGFGVEREYDLLSIP